MKPEPVRTFWSISSFTLLTVASGGHPRGGVEGPFVGYGRRR